MSLNKQTEEEGHKARRFGSAGHSSHWQAQEGDGETERRCNLKPLGVAWFLIQNDTL